MRAASITFVLVYGVVAATPCAADSSAQPSASPHAHHHHHDAPEDSGSEADADPAAELSRPCPCGCGGSATTASSTQRLPIALLLVAPNPPLLRGAPARHDDHSLRFVDVPGDLDPIPI